MIYLFKCFDQNGEVVAEAPLLIKDPAKVYTAVKIGFPDAIATVPGRFLEALHIAIDVKRGEGVYSAVPEYCAIAIGLPPSAEYRQKLEEEFAQEQIREMAEAPDEEAVSEEIPAEAPAETRPTRRRRRRSE